MNFITKKALPRRAFLRGAGSALIGLPLLESMVPALTAMAATPANPVKRLGFVYIPNGVCQGPWWPKSGTPKLQLSPTLTPLEPFRDQVTVLRGLAHHQAEGLGDGDAEHTRAGAVWLNGVHPKLTEGADVRAGKTADQIAAEQICKDTALTSLELALEPNYMVGNCNDGYSCVYMNTFVWKTATMPLPMENNPRVVFERLFGMGGSAAERLAEIRKDRSILDSVSEEMASLQKSLGASDRVIVSEYLDSVREIEQRLRKAETRIDGGALPEVLDRPAGIPESFEEHAKLMFDLQWLAYRTDVTRVITFQLAREFSNRSYPNVGVTDGHHTVSHHENNAEKQEKYSKINKYHVELFAYFLGKMQSTPDGDGSLLDHSMFLYGGGISDGNKHDHSNLPLLVAGGGAGSLKGGRYLEYPDATPMSNLLISLLDKAGVKLDHLGDSTGPLKLNGLSAL
jgi:Protein of unknown function (DUF1552)